MSFTADALPDQTAAGSIMPDHSGISDRLRAFSGQLIPAGWPTSRPLSLNSECLLVHAPVSLLSVHLISRLLGAGHALMFAAESPSTEQALHDLRALSGRAHLPLTGAELSVHAARGRQPDLGLPTATWETLHRTVSGTVQLIPAAGLTESAATGLPGTLGLLNLASVTGTGLTLVSALHGGVREERPSDDSNPDEVPTAYLRDWVTERLVTAACDLGVRTTTVRLPWLTPDPADADLWEDSLFTRSFQDALNGGTWPETGLAIPWMTVDRAATGLARHVNAQRNQDVTVPPVMNMYDFASTGPELRRALAASLPQSRLIPAGIWHEKASLTARDAISNLTGSAPERRGYTSQGWTPAPLPGLQSETYWRLVLDAHFEVPLPGGQGPAGLQDNDRLEAASD